MECDHWYSGRMLIMLLPGSSSGGAISEGPLECVDRTAKGAGGI